MKRVGLTIGYDGTNYVGWQIQKNGLAVEAVINEKLSQLTGENIVVIGASRTDSGVHALGNVAVFDTESGIPAEKFSFALNQRLPEDIRIQKSYPLPLDFHPRYQNQVTKTYEYRIENSRFPQPVNRLYSHYIFLPLDLDAMKQAASYLVGEHDFKSFCSLRTQVLTTTRTIYKLELHQEGTILTICISGNGFLYNMVRIIVGTLLKVGLGVYDPEHVREILLACDRSQAGPKVPAKGLTLVGIRYGADRETEESNV